MVLMLQDADSWLHGVQKKHIENAFLYVIPQWRLKIAMTPTLQRIEKLAMSGLDSLAITRQVYFLLPTHAFQSDPDRHFQVYQAVADFFKVPFQ